VTLLIKGSTYKEIITTLKKKGICDITRINWDILGDSQAQTSVKEVINMFFRYFWAIVNQPI